VSDAPPQRWLALVADPVQRGMTLLSSDLFMRWKIFFVPELCKCLFLGGWG